MKYAVLVPVGQDVYEDRTFHSEIAKAQLWDALEQQNLVATGEIELNFARNMFYLETRVESYGVCRAVVEVAPASTDKP